MSHGMLPWLQGPKLVLMSEEYQAAHLDYDLIVVGAGIAGAAAAFKFAEAGLQVAVLDKEAQPASVGSGNQQGMLYLKLSPSLTYQNELLILGFEKTLSLLTLLTARGLLTKGQDWDDCGLIQLSNSQKQQDKQQALAKRYPPELLYFIDKAAASEIAGARLNSGGLFFPRSGWVSPPSFVAALLNHPRITFMGAQSVTALHAAHLSLATPLWQVDTSTDSYRSKLVILAMADQVTAIEQCRNIPFTVVRGQTTTVKRDCQLSTVVSGEGYIAPSQFVDGVALSTFGATFHRHQPAGNPTASEHLENIAMLAASSPDIVEKLGLEQGEESPQFKMLAGRASTRASAMGSVPIVGPIAVRETFLERFSAIRLDAKAVPAAAVPWELGLYLTTAHGSRGMITASIAADILYDYIYGTLMPAEEMPSKETSLGEALSGETLSKEATSAYSPELLSALHPNRFYYRELRFNQ